MLKSLLGPARLFSLDSITPRRQKANERTECLVERLGPRTGALLCAFPMFRYQEGFVLFCFQVYFSPPERTLAPSSGHLATAPPPLTPLPARSSFPPSSEAHHLSCTYLPRDLLHSPKGKTRRGALERVCFPSPPLFLAPTRAYPCSLLPLSRTHSCWEACSPDPLTRGGTGWEDPWQLQPRARCRPSTRPLPPSTLCPSFVTLYITSFSKATLCLQYSWSFKYPQWWKRVCYLKQNFYLLCLSVAFCSDSFPPLYYQNVLHQKGMGHMGAGLVLVESFPECTRVSIFIHCLPPGQPTVDFG